MATSIISTNDLKLDNMIKLIPASQTTPEDYFAADNTIVRSEFYQTGNRVVFESHGRRFTWTPQEMKYIDAFGMEDVIYNVQDVPLEVKANYARYNRAMPDVDDWFIQENDRLKHSILVQGFQRDPLDFLTGPIDFAFGGQIEFDTDLVAWADGVEHSGDFETIGAIEIKDANGETFFTLPEVVAYDSKIPDRAVTLGKYRAFFTSTGVLAFQIIVDNAWISDIDRMYPIVIDPTVVVSSAYDTLGNGGRKLVRLSNGWIVGAAYNSSNKTIYFYVSKDNGVSWSQLCYLYNSDRTLSPFAIASSGTKVYWLCANTDGTHFFVSGLNFDATVVNNVNQWNGATGAQFSTPSVGSPESSGQTAIGTALSLAMDSTGVLHAAWVTKNSTYSNSFNIRYSKSTDGGQTWSAPTQITTYNTAGYDQTNPCVILRSNNYPSIIYQGYDGTNYYISSISWNGSAWNAPVRVYNGGAYVQSNSCAVVDSTDNIDVFWHGKDTTEGTVFNIRTARSTDGGASFGTATKLTNGNTYNQTNPTVTMNPNSNDKYLFFQGRASGTYDQIRKMIYSSGTWSAITDLTTNTTNNAQNPAALWSKNNMNSSDAARWIYQDMQASAVKYDSITLNASPNAPTGLTRANFDATQAADFTWVFSDPDSGDSPSAYQLEFYDTTNLSTPVVSVPKTGSILSKYTAAANALQNGKTYQWRVMTYDQLGAVSQWSSYATFKCSSTPTATVTDPAVNATVTSDSYTFVGSYVQANGVTQKSFQFKLWDSAGVNSVQDSGEIIGTSNMKTFLNLSNNTSYKIEFIVTSQDGVTASSGKQSFSVAYTPPATPTVTLTNDAINARVQVNFTNPAPGGGQPTVSRNDIYRRKVDDATWKLIQQVATSPYYDYTCPSGNYEYGVTGISVSGAVSDYGTAQIATSFTGEWIIDEQTPAASVRFLYNQTETGIDTEQDVAYIKTFAVYPRERKGQTFYHTGTLSALYLKQDEDIATQIQAVEAMVKTNRTFVLKLMNGLIYRIRPSKPRHKTKYGNSIADITITWTEVGDV